MPQAHSAFGRNGTLADSTRTTLTLAKDKIASTAYSVRWPPLRMINIIEDKLCSEMPGKTHCKSGLRYCEVSCEDIKSPDALKIRHIHAAVMSQQKTILCNRATARMKPWRHGRVEHQQTRAGWDAHAHRADGWLSYPARRIRKPLTGEFCRSFSLVSVRDGV